MSTEKRYKYPRTYHLPDSPGKSSDDKSLRDYNHFIGKDVVITEKMDGENTTLYRDGFHARSIDSRHHESRDYVSAKQSLIGHLIPHGMRICAENLYARHSIAYDDIPSYILAFSCWEEDNCLSWSDSKVIFEMLGLCHVRVLYEGVFDLNVINQLKESLDFSKVEGFVVRNSGEFRFDDFSKNVAKFVRENHIQTEKHWMLQKIAKNTIRG